MYYPNKKGDEMDDNVQVQMFIYAHNIMYLNTHWVIPGCIKLINTKNCTDKYLTYLV